MEYKQKCMPVRTIFFLQFRKQQKVQLRNVQHVPVTSTVVSRLRKSHVLKQVVPRNRRSLKIQYVSFWPMLNTRTFVCLPCKRLFRKCSVSIKPNNSFEKYIEGPFMYMVWHMTDTSFGSCANQRQCYVHLISRYESVIFHVIVAIPPGTLESKKIACSLLYCQYQLQ